MRTWLLPLAAVWLMAAPASAQQGKGKEPDRQESKQESKPEVKQGDVELLKVTEDGIVFKDESGQEVQIGDFEQLSLEQLLAEPVVTTGGKREQTVSATVSTISVLTRDELQLLPYFYLGELLSVLPGMDVRWGKMQRLYVGVRGLGGTALNSRLLLLWNGLPHNDPFTGELSAGHFMPVGDIERLEVIRGPGSTLYGANAFSGVINVITSSKDDPQHVELSTLAGSGLTVRAMGGANRKLGPLQVGASLEFLRTEGSFPALSRIVGDQNVSMKNDDLRSVAVGGHVQWKGLRLEGRFVDGERGMPGTLTTDGQGKVLACTTCHNSSSPYGQGIKYPATPSSCGQCHFQPNDREYVRRGSAALRLDQPLGAGLRLSASAYHNEWRTTFKIFPTAPFLTQPRAVTLDSNRRTSGVDVNVSHAWRKINSAVLGGELRRYEAASQIMVTPSGTDVVQYQGAVYAEDELHPVRWLSLTAGVRYDHDSLASGAFTPRGGLVISPLERLALKASVARAFRNPSLAELYVLDQRGRYSVSGNPALKTEWITNLEGGVSWSLVKPIGVRLGGTFFYSMARDLISFRATGADTATFVNLKQARVIGFEAEAELDLLKKPDLKLSVNYSFQRATDEQGARLPYAPESKLNAVLLGRHGRFGALLRVRYVGEQLDEIGIPVQRFLTLDASLQAELWSGLSASLWATNLTGSDHQESLGIPTAPRSVFFSVGYSSRPAR